MFHNHIHIFHVLMDYSLIIHLQTHHSHYLYYHRFQYEVIYHLDIYRPSFHLHIFLFLFYTFMYLDHKILFVHLYTLLAGLVGLEYHKHLIDYYYCYLSGLDYMFRHSYLIDHIFHHDLHLIIFHHKHLITYFLIMYFHLMIKKSYHKRHLDYHDHYLFVKDCRSLHNYQTNHLLHHDLHHLLIAQIMLHY